MNIQIDKRLDNASRYGRRDEAAERPLAARPAGPPGPVSGRPNLRFLGRSATLGPLVIVAVLSSIEGWHRATTTHLECQQVAHGAFADVYLGIIQFWQNLAGMTGLTNGPLVAAIADLVAVSCALFFALFAGLGAAMSQFWGMAMPG